MYVLCPFTKNWNIWFDQRVRDGFFWLQLQSPAVGDGGSSELDYGRPTKGPAAQSGSENHFLVASTVIA